MLGEYTIFVSTELYCGVSGETRKPPLYILHISLECVFYLYLFIFIYSIY